MSTDSFQQGQHYSVDTVNSEYTSYKVTNDVHIFNVEQGRRFFLKLNGNAGSGTTDLYKDGQKLTSSRSGTIDVNSDSVEIQIVSPGHEGNYRIRSSNGAELTYRLKVTGTEISSYGDNYGVKTLSTQINNFDIC